MERGIEDVSEKRRREVTIYLGEIGTVVIRMRTAEGELG